MGIMCTKHVISELTSVLKNAVLKVKKSARSHKEVYWRMKTVELRDVCNSQQSMW